MILDTPISQLRSLLDAIKDRQTNEFRKQVSLTEWMTKMIATTVAASAGEGSEKAVESLSTAQFPWEGAEKVKTDADYLRPDQDFSYIDNGVGDASAADKNEGKKMPFDGFSTIM